MRWLGRGVYHCCDYFWVSFAWDFCGCFGLYWIFFGFVSFYLGGGVWGYILVLNLVLKVHISSYLMSKL